MRMVRKFEVEIAERVTVRMPKDAEILHIDAHYKQQQPGYSLLIWALASIQKGWMADLALCEERDLYVISAGRPVAEDFAARHLATVHNADHSLVWHVFDA